MRYREGAPADELGAGISFKGARSIVFRRTVGRGSGMSRLGYHPVEAPSSGVAGPLFAGGKAA